MLKPAKRKKEQLIHELKVTFGFFVKSCINWNISLLITLHTMISPISADSIEE